MWCYRDIKMRSESDVSSVETGAVKHVPVTYSPLPSKKCQRFSFFRKRTKRMVFKNGVFNIEKYKQRKYHIFPDFVTAFIETQWRWTLMFCFLTYIFTWLAFGAIWWLINYVHGDFEEGHLPDNNNVTGWTPCIKNIYGFTSTFLFSIEIHTALGYGTRSITLECPVTIFVMSIEAILGTIMQSFIVGIVFAKLTRPKNRAQTLLFSKNAIINQRDRDLSLIFRVGNIRKSRLIDVNVQAYLIRYQTKSACLSDNEQIKLDLVVDACDDIVFMFPLSMVHRIDKNSPLYTLSAEELIRSKIEILVVLEGIIESTGQPVQVRSSYTSREILWGHRFVDMVKFRADKRGYEIDYSKFDETKQINTPLCSAAQLGDFYICIMKSMRALPDIGLQT